MRFLFHGPIKRIAGDHLEVPLNGPAKLRDLLGPLSSRLEKMIPYGTETTEAQLMANLSFFRNERLLRFEDAIEDNDVVGVFLPATGG